MGKVRKDDQVEADGQVEGEEPEAEEEEAPQEESKPEVKYTQADLDRIAGKTRDEEKKKYERAKAKAEEEARKATLKEQEDYKGLLEQEEKKAAELEKKLEEAESIQEERDAAQGRIEALEKMLKAQLKPKLERVPELFRDFVDRMSVEEQAAWFAKNEDKLDAPNGAVNRPAGSRATGKPATVTTDDERARREREAMRRNPLTRI